MKTFAFLLCLLVIECAFSQDSPDDWQKHYDDTWYTDELGKLGIIDKKDKDNDFSDIAEGDPGDSVETGDWNEELNLGSIESNIEEELKALDSANNNIDVDYQYEDNRDEAKLNNDNSIYNKDQSEEMDAAVPMEAPKLDNENKQSSPIELKKDNIEENLQALPLPPVADLDDSNDFSDLTAEASEQFEIKVEPDSMVQETKQILEEISNEFDEPSEVSEHNESNDIDLEVNHDNINKDGNLEFDANESSQQIIDTENNFEILNSSLDSVEDFVVPQEPLQYPKTISTLNKFEKIIESSEAKKDQTDQSKRGGFELQPESSDNISFEKTQNSNEFENNVEHNEETINENINAEEVNYSIKDEMLSKLDTEDTKTMNEIKERVVEDDLPMAEISKSDDEIQSDLEKLFETMDKLSDSAEENVDQPNFVHDYEDKLQRPYKEGVVLSQRENDMYYDISEEDQNEPKPEHNIELLSEENKSNNNLLVETKVYKSEEIMDSKPVDYEEIADDDLEKLFAQFANSNEVKELPNLEDDIVEISVNKTDPDAEIMFDKLKSDANESIEEKQIEITKPIEPTVSNDDNGNPIHLSVPTKSVEDLTDFEYEQLMQQFTFEPRNDIILVNCDDEPGQIINVLNVNETVEITSCNYPNAYPTNKVMEWVFEGEGKGFEFVINDFDVNGIIGDYLLVKAEGSSATGNLLFSYHLNGPKKYGFLDVDRLTVTFEAKLSFPFRTGFKFTVKRLDTSRAPATDVEEVTPAPLQAPPAHLKLSVGPVPLDQFSDIKEDFRRILADMATMFINANNIDPGKESTLETTQILRLSLCNMHWPDYKNCTEVKFGVGLVYEDDPDAGLTEGQLESMWMTYSVIDPFATRLRRLGISEFKAPDDSSVLMVWTVIASGVIISMAMLSFALWRFSCFGDYTRMGPFNDTESLNNEKRDLDLYPTPHQTLPPLYSDYMWGDKMDTRVDMGGFANKSYAQDDLFNIDSDEDTVANRDRSDSVMRNDVHEA